jgi:uncharacterized protein YbaR (Trm112 family)
MQLRLLDILADPDDSSRWPLKIHIINKETRKRENKPVPHESTNLLCKFYCAKNGEFLVSDPLGENETTLEKSKLDKIVKLGECYDCIKDEITEAIIYTEVEGKIKWFIVDREIAVMYPLNLRDRKQEESFFRKHPGVFEVLNLTYETVTE